MKECIHTQVVWTDFSFSIYKYYFVCVIYIIIHHNGGNWNGDVIKDGS